MACYAVTVAVHVASIWLSTLPPFQAIGGFADRVSRVRVALADQRLRF